MEPTNRSTIIRVSRAFGRLMPAAVLTSALAVMAALLTAAPAVQAAPNRSYSARAETGTGFGDVAAPLALTRTAYLPYASGQLQTLFGVEMSFIGNSGGLTPVVAAGTGWVRRAGVSWLQIESSESTYNWSAISGMEAEFRAAAGRNLRTILVVRGTPGWAQLYAGVSCGPIKRDKLASFGRFMFQLVNRYSRAPYYVMDYEIWNEPDVDHRLPGIPPDSLLGCWGEGSDPYYGGGYFADMLKAVYPEVKRANPAAQVLVGGLLMDCDPNYPPAGKNCTPSKFLEGILRNGGGPYFDGVAFHAYDYYANALGWYSNTNWSAQSTTTGPVIAAKANFIKSLLTTYGAGGKYLMNTESAVLWDCPGGCTSDFEWTKAYYVAHAYGMAISLNLKSNIWYSVLGWPGRNTALLRPDLSPYLAYTAFKAANTLLGDAVPTGSITAADVGGATGVTGYKFRRGSRAVWLIWSQDGANRTITLPSMPLAVWDVLGNRLTSSASLSLTGPGRLLVYVDFGR